LFLTNPKRSRCVRMCECCRSCHEYCWRCYLPG